VNRVVGRLRLAGALAGVLVAVLGGAALGVTLGERASEPDVQQLVVGDPALAPDDFPALRSPGGFTGFEGSPALRGRAFRVGEVVEATESGLQVSGDGATMNVSLRDESRLFRLAPLSGSLESGDVVLVRLEGQDVTGVLRVPRDLDDDELEPLE
jgi:hypothetical protein